MNWRSWRCEIIRVFVSALRYIISALDASVIGLNTDSGGDGLGGGIGVLPNAFLEAFSQGSGDLLVEHVCRLIRFSQALLPKDQFRVRLRMVEFGRRGRNEQQPLAIERRKRLTYCQTTAIRQIDLDVDFPLGGSCPQSTVTIRPQSSLSTKFAIDEFFSVR